jgi:predicted nicotinamide N-methyase
VRGPVATVATVASPNFVPAPFVALKDERGGDATIPHLHSDHVPVFLYETTVPVTDGVDSVDISLVLPESEDLIVDVYASLGRPDDDPHWADLWQGSVALAEEVLSNPERVRGKRVIDLGTGLGLAGIAAAMAGAKEVVLTDREPRALYCALCAAAANGLKVVADPDSPSGSFLDASGPGLDGVRLPALLEFPERRPLVRREGESAVVSARVLDWFAPDVDQFGDEGFDVVLACDVLYTPAAVDVIAPLVLRLFEGCAAAAADATRANEAPRTFVLADPPGRFPENHDRFLRLMESRAVAERGGTEERSRVARVDPAVKRDCVNLVGEVMTVELSTYRIEG